MKGTTKWLTALAIFAALSGSAQAETYKVGGTRALLIQVSDFSAADLVINFSAKASSVASQLFYALYSGADNVIGGTLRGSGNVNRSITTNANSLLLSITANDSYAVSGIGVKGVDPSKVTIIGEVDKSSTVTVSGNVSAVPETETYALMGLGLFALMLVHRRKGAVRKSDQEFLAI